MKHFPAGDCCCPSRLPALKSTRGRRRRKQEAASSPSADKASRFTGILPELGGSFPSITTAAANYYFLESSFPLIPNGLFSRLCLQDRSSPPGRGAQQVQPRQQQEAQGSGNPTRPAVTDPNRRGCPSTFHSATSPFQNAFYGLFTRWTLDTRWTQIKDCAYYRLQGKLMYWLGLYIRE